MLEKFDSLEDRDILDPAAGAGGLIAAAILAGANPRRCYCIELDPDIAKICRNRLSKLGVPSWHIKVGNALDSSSYDFPEENKTYVEISKDQNFITFIFVIDFKEVKRVKYSLEKQKGKAKMMILKLKEKKIQMFKNY